MSKKDDDAGVGSAEASETTTNSDGAEGQNQRQAHLAYQRIVGMLHNLPDSELILLNFDVQALIGRILAAAPAVMRRRSLLEPVRPFDMRYVDHFEDFGLGLAHTHTLVRIAEGTIAGDDIPYLTARRAQLLRDAQSAAGWGLIDSAKLTNLTHTNNHSDLAIDSLALAELFLQNEERLRGKCPVPHEVLIEVRDRANRVMLALSAKGEKQVSVTEATLERRRAATLAVLAYRAIRTALLMVLKKQELVNEILPPLQVRKRTKKKGDSGPSNDIPAGDTLQDELGDDVGASQDTTDADEEAVVEAAEAPRQSVITSKVARPLKAAVGDGLPGASPVDDEE